MYISFLYALFNNKIKAPLINVPIHGECKKQGYLLQQKFMTKLFQIMVRYIEKKISILVVQPIREQVFRPTASIEQ